MLSGFHSRELLGLGPPRHLLALVQGVETLSHGCVGMWNWVTAEGFTVTWRRKQQY